jgi:uncharacterized 2Fe-2S/4Fe-4S cluster protein (DUF4445 family)
MNIGERIKIKLNDREFEAEKGANLMEAAVSAGIMLRSDCGGRGRCGKCLVRVADSGHQALSGLDAAERTALAEDRLRAGWRLSCRTRVFEDVRIEIPTESLLTAEVVQKGLPVLLPRLEARKPIERPDAAPAFGLAVDLGTTTIAVYLCDLASGHVAGSTSVRNPQAIFGDDVISRISAVQTAESGLLRLQKMAVQAIDWAVSALCRRLRIDPLQVECGMVVGNSTMIHLLLGEDPSSIGVFPFTPHFSADQIRNGAAIGMNFNPTVQLHTLPLMSGFLGADLIGAALAVDIFTRTPGTLLVDVGTNGEIILVTDGGFAATSCATGPAFEGACIRHGMQATSGAVDAVRFDPKTGRLDYSLIQRDPKHTQPASGLCGSGVISAVAELLRTGAITKSGSFNTDFGSPCWRNAENGTLEFEIVDGANSRSKSPIVLSQPDVRAVQLAKGALRTGIELLCLENHMQRPAKILLAGAFGGHINKTDALRIGMFPDIAEEDIEVVGNAAGAGAILALLQDDCYSKAKEIANRTRVFDLAAHPDFQTLFVENLSF